MYKAGILLMLPKEDYNKLWNDAKTLLIIDMLGLYAPTQLLQS